MTYDLETVEILRSLLRRTAGQADALDRYYQDFKELHGVRPTAVEVYQDGYNPLSVRQRSGSWVRHVAAQGDLDVSQREALSDHGALLDALDTTDMTRSYKMLVLLATLNAGAFPGPIHIDKLVDEMERLANRHRRGPRRPARPDPPPRAESHRRMDRRQGNRRRLVLLIRGPSLQDDYGGAAGGGGRVAGTRPRAGGVAPDAVSRSGRGPDRRLRDPESQPRKGAADSVLARGTRAQRSAVGLDRHRDQRRALPSKLRQGRRQRRAPAGAGRQRAAEDPAQLVRRRRRRGRHPASRGSRAEGRRLASEALGQRAGQLQLWRSYSREEIPPLFGLEFSTANWNVGFVKRPGHIFLLTTLDKAGHGSEFQYKDHFLSPTEFEWQSQNRTSQASADGQDIRGHAEKGIRVHLFVRAQKKRNGGGAAPFVYCGDVTFDDWDGGKPITVKWRLPEPVPDRLRDELMVPSGTS